MISVEQTKYKIIKGRVQYSHTVLNDIYTMNHMSGERY